MVSYFLLNDISEDWDKQNFQEIYFITCFSKSHHCYLLKGHSRQNWTTFRQI